MTTKMMKIVVVARSVGLLTLDPGIIKLKLGTL